MEVTGVFAVCAASFGSTAETKGVSQPTGESDSQRPVVDVDFCSASHAQIDRLCRVGVLEEPIALKPTTALGASIAPKPGILPTDIAAEVFEPTPLAGNGLVRSWPGYSLHWCASALYHHPLYFEDAPLERYGHSRRPCLQPVMSAGKFIGSTLLLPYKMGLEAPCEPLYALGYYRPGTESPHFIYPFPLRLDASLFEAGTIAGLIFLIP